MKQGEAANSAFIEPMKALRVTELPGGDWLYELKFDGYRANFQCWNDPADATTPSG
jgi:ATP-dependent DNA ligase